MGLAKWSTQCSRKWSVFSIRLQNGVYFQFSWQFLLIMELITFAFFKEKSVWNQTSFDFRLSVWLVTKKKKIIKKIFLFPFIFFKAINKKKQFPVFIYEIVTFIYESVALKEVQMRSRECAKNVMFASSFVIILRVRASFYINLYVRILFSLEKLKSTLF